MIALSVNKLALSFGANKIFSDVSFALNEGDRLGIIGVNGCGKSSLFKLITREYTPEDGSIYISKDKTIGILRQDVALEGISTENEKFSALEVMYLSFGDLIATEQKLKELECEANILQIFLSFKEQITHCYFLFLCVF